MTLFGWPLRRKSTRPPQTSVITLADDTMAAWVPTHRHRKGGLYRLLAFGTNEADRSSVAIYDDAAGTVWVRSAAEFNDGRFASLPEAMGRD